MNKEELQQELQKLIDTIEPAIDPDPVGYVTAAHHAAVLRGLVDVVRALQWAVAE